MNYSSVSIDSFNWFWILASGFAPLRTVLASQVNPEDAGWGGVLSSCRNFWMVLGVSGVCSPTLDVSQAAQRMEHSTWSPHSCSATHLAPWAGPYGGEKLGCLA